MFCPIEHTICFVYSIYTLLFNNENIIHLTETNSSSFTKTFENILKTSKLLWQKANSSVKYFSIIAENDDSAIVEQSICNYFITKRCDLKFKKTFN